MAKRKEVYTEEEIRENRTFPSKNTFLLVVLIIIQIAAIYFAAVYNPQPIDVIKDYRVSVVPLDDGKLDITYSIKWLPLSDEALTWVDIGLANVNVQILDFALSSNISSYQLITDDDGYVALRLHFDRAYRSGETFEFSFRIEQGDLLCYTDTYFYEFVPSWFNEIPVESYAFLWAKDGADSSNSDTTDKNSYVWRGSLDCGGYRVMQIRYPKDAFSGNKTVTYEPFDDEGAYNGIKESKIVAVVFAAVICVILAVIELTIVDSYVSYHKGRGFLTGYGHYVHVYGRANPHYIHERDKHNAASSGRGGGGGCACACACACAGGGRAGCSQKDFYSFKKK